MTITINSTTRTKRTNPTKEPIMKKRMKNGHLLGFGLIMVILSGFGPIYYFLHFLDCTYLGTCATVDLPLDKSTFKYLDCSKIHTLPIVKVLGKGKQKTVFEVILPTGEHVAAKRCSNPTCESTKLIMYEEFFYHTLFEAYGDDSLTYYGFCQFGLGNWQQKFDPEILTMGSTLFIELGSPLLDDWVNWELKEEEIRPKSKDDLENLRDIARQYDTFPGGPLLMKEDNIYPHQYMRNKAGKLYHIDFDMVEQMPPPVNSTLEKNCAVMLGGFAKLDKGDSRLDCSIRYKEQNSETEITETANKVTHDAFPPTHHSTNQTRPPFDISPLPTNMALVHIGKTAGSTLSQILRHGCHMFVSHPCQSRHNNYGTKGSPGKESRVSQLTKGYYHFNPVPVDNHDGYIISSRNPIDRVVSAFLYVHPSNVAVTTKHRARFLNKNKGKENAFVEEYNKFFKCFPDVSTLAVNLVGDGECATLGRYVLGGAGESAIMKSEMLNHFGYGYQFYASSLLAAGSRIFVLRQEHLATDWINLNLRLGGAPHEISGATKAFQDKLAVKLPAGGLSKEERHGLCVVLAKELNVYLRIIDTADNLTDKEKEESRQEISEGCSL